MNISGQSIHARTVIEDALEDEIPFKTPKYRFIPFFFFFLRRIIDLFLVTNSINTWIFRPKLVRVVKFKFNTSL